MRKTLIYVAAAAFLPGCDAGTEVGSAELVQRRAIGDTTEVITNLSEVTPRGVSEVLSVGAFESEDLNYVFGRVGSVAIGPDGDVYVLDSQAMEIRRFNPDGEWVGSYGREGQGPGEFSSPSSIAVRSDGAVFARDNRNARLQGFTPDPVQWPVVEPGFFTSAPLWIDDRGRAHVVTRNPEAEFGSPNSQEVRVVNRDGEVVRTSSPPFSSLEIPVAKAEFNDGTSRRSASAPVPFSPQALWAVHPTGAWVGGISSDYLIEMWGPERSGVLRFGRRASVLPVAPEERAFFMNRIQTSLRNTDPNWDWSGLEVPRTKRPFTGVFAGLDGRIWVRISQPGFTRPDPGATEDDPDAVVWSEPVVFDVFSESGEYVMSVAADPEMSLAPTPVFRADSIWGVARDDLGVAYVKKWTVRGTR